MTTLEEKKARYWELSHAMQAAVDLKMQKLAKDTSPKHLRVGVNSAMVSQGALVALLMKKGIISEDEYYDELIAAMGREVEMYKQTLRELYGGIDIELH